MRSAGGRPSWCRNGPASFASAASALTARGDRGAGSAVDLVIVVRDCDRPFAERAHQFDATKLPVPADLLIYNEQQFAALTLTPSRFGRALQQETIWVDGVEAKREPNIRQKQSKDAV